MSPTISYNNNKYKVHKVMKYDKPLGIVPLMTYQYHMLHSTVPTPNKI